MSVRNAFMGGENLVVDLDRVPQVDTKPSAKSFDSGNIIYDRTENAFYRSDGSSWTAVSILRDSVSSLSSLKELAGANQELVHLDVDNRRGFFQWVAGDQSSNVSNDPEEGVWVAPDSDASGASGAWKRLHDGRVRVDWFGTVADGATDDSSAIQAALDYFIATAYANGAGGTLEFGPGRDYAVANEISYDFTSTWTYRAVIDFRGATINSSVAGGYVFAFDAQDLVRGWDIHGFDIRGSGTELGGIFIDGGGVGGASGEFFYNFKIHDGAISGVGGKAIEIRHNAFEFQVESVNMGGSDVERAENATITSGSTTLTADAGSFSADDVGRHIFIPSAGDTPGLFTRVASHTGDTQVELADAATATKSSGHAYMGPSHGIYLETVNPGGIVSSVGITTCRTQGFVRGMEAITAGDIKVFGGTYNEAQREGVYIRNGSIGVCLGVHVENNWEEAASIGDGGGGLRVDNRAMIQGVRAPTSRNQQYGVHVFASNRSVVQGVYESGTGAYSALLDGQADSLFFVADLSNYVQESDVQVVDMAGGDDRLVQMVGQGAHPGYMHLLFDTANNAAPELRMYAWNGVSDDRQAYRIIAGGSNMKIQRGTSTASPGSESYSDTQIELHPSGHLKLGASGKQVGFFGSSGVGQQNISGSRGGNVALENLLSALESLGLIADSTTSS